MASDARHPLTSPSHLATEPSHAPWPRRLPSAAASRSSLCPWRRRRRRRFSPAALGRRTDSRTVSPATVPGAAGSAPPYPAMHANGNGHAMHANGNGHMNGHQRQASDPASELELTFAPAPAKFAPVRHQRQVSDPVSE